MIEPGTRVRFGKSPWMVGTVMAYQKARNRPGNVYLVRRDDGEGVNSYVSPRGETFQCVEVRPDWIEVQQ